MLQAGNITLAKVGAAFLGRFGQGSGVPMAVHRGITSRVEARDAFGCDSWVQVMNLLGVQPVGLKARRGGEKVQGSFQLG